MAFIKNNFFQIVVTVLLTVLLFIGSYFVSKIEAHEKRINAQEILSAEIVQCVKALEAQITASEKRVIEKVNRTEILIDLLLERGK